MNTALCTYDETFNSEVSFFVADGYFLLGEKTNNSQPIPHTNFTKKIFEKGLSTFENSSNNFILDSIIINQDENCYTAIWVHKNGIQNGYLQVDFI